MIERPAKQVFFRMTINRPFDFISFGINVGIYFQPRFSRGHLGTSDSVFNRHQWSPVPAACDLGEQSMLNGIEL